MSGTKSVEHYAVLGTYHAGGQIGRIWIPRGSAAAPVAGTLAGEIVSPSPRAAVRMIEAYNPVHVDGILERGSVLPGEIALFPQPEAEAMVTAGIATPQDGWGYYWGENWDA